MLSQTIIYQSTELVGTITISRPEFNNAINTQVVEKFTTVCNNISIDKSIKVLIITGAGDIFSSGAEPNELKKIDKESASLSLSIASLVADLEIPTIAAINGDAYGQGLELALACDLRIAAHTAEFALNQVAAGLVPWDGATQRLPRIVGRTKAMEMILTNEIIDAKEAFRIGLVNKVVSPGELITVANEIALKMALQSPTAMSFAKEAIYNGMDLTLEQGLRLEADLYFLLHTTEDRTEGIRAFLGKRTPQFKGK